MDSVLIVEDDEVIRRLAQDVLEDEGFEVVTAGSGDEALAVLADRQPPAVIVLDLLMPGIDAYTFAERIPEECRSVPILVLSGASDIDQTARDIGARANLAKPFELDEFVAMVRGLAGR